MADYRDAEHAAMERVAQLEREKQELAERESALRKRNVELEAQMRSMPHSPQATAARQQRVLVVAGVVGVLMLLVLFIAGAAFFGFSRSVPQRVGMTTSSIGVIATHG